MSNPQYYLVLARAERAAAEAKARVFEEAAAQERAQLQDHVDQTTSPLGQRRHCAAVKRRIAAGDEVAAIVGRRHLLSQQALANELAALSAKPRKAQAAPTVGPDALRAKLGLVAGGRS